MVVVFGGFAIVELILPEANKFSTIIMVGFKLKSLFSAFLLQLRFTLDHVLILLLIFFIELESLTNFNVCFYVLVVHIILSQHWFVV